ncbi:MAG: hypothetical protein M1818_003351 [Claussenomyces sp. TS43310]|nr:MAG: hypothetical protein M1818_003351 [Claussenomyces sp. TS43310]
MSARESPRPRRRERHGDRERRKRRSHNPNRRTSRAPSSEPTSQTLSADSLARLNQLNEKAARTPEARHHRPRPEWPREVLDESIVVEKRRRYHEVPEETITPEKRRRHRKRRRRVVSGSLLEEGESKRLKGLRGGAGYDDPYQGRYEDEDVRKRRKKIYVAIGVFILLLAIIIPVAVVVSNKHKSTSDPASTPKQANGLSNGDVPEADRNTQMDPSTWLDLTAFNTTYTNETVGGLPIIGLNSTWDNSQRANANTPPLNESWGDYAKTPARGVNLGGWLSLEPFIAPSLFNSYDSGLGIIDEWTLCAHLGASGAQSTLENHYLSFVTEQTFIDIANAGLDHVRIPFSYWAVVTYDGDPYVFRTSWRYLLRGIEWARKHGLRINLDLHGLPGSQNGWNHSGRQGEIGWLNGTDGALNAQRSLDVHNSLSQFFAQPRYKNIIAFYGLANEPRMTELVPSEVNAWSGNAYEIIRNNGVDAYIVFGDGFLGLNNWQGKLQNYTGLLLDVHQYVIFNVQQIVFNHTAKVSYACTGWTQQAEQSMSVSTGFGPTIFAEWSQADTDCETYLNDVGVGNRWTGTYNTGNSLTQVLSATCPTTASQCECRDATADPSQYSAPYKQFLQMFAEAQMDSFEHGWGWFYWTWKTESAPQWSYEAGLAAGILPAKAYAPEFNCSMSVPSFSGLPEYY